MSITLKLYNCPSPTNCVNKTLNDGEGGNLLRTVTAKINGTMNRTDPVFTVECDVNTATALGNCNYLIAGEPLNRNYFVVSIDFTIAKTAVIACHVDLLTTFASRLDATTLNYIRGWGDITEMDDSSYPISDYMVEQWYNLQRWTDIFSNKGSARQYLLRTVAAETEPITYHDFNDNQVFWNGHYATNDQGQISYYECFIFHPTGAKSFYPTSTPRTDITGLTLVNDKDIIRYDGKAWRWDLEEFWLKYLGTTT